MTTTRERVCLSLLQRYIPFSLYFFFELNVKFNLKKKNFFYNKCVLFLWWKLKLYPPISNKSSKSILYQTSVASLLQSLYHLSFALEWAYFSYSYQEALSRGLLESFSFPMSSSVTLSPDHVYSRLKHVLDKKQMHLPSLCIPHNSHHFFPPQRKLVSQNTLHQSLPNLSRVSTLEK